MDTGDDSNLEGWALAPFLEKVTSTAPNIIYIFNQQTQSNEYVNRSIGESLGYSTSEIQGMGNTLFLQLCHPDDLHSIGPHLEAVREMADGEVVTLEYRMKHKDGGWVWLLGYDTVFERDQSGEVIRHLGIATDITEQKTAQQRALVEQRAADAANEELRSFAYSMSHDMKAPSNTLHLLLTELRQVHGDSLDDDAKELLRMSLSTVDRMRGLVDDVLGYTQVVGQKIEFTDVDLNELVNELSQDLLAETSMNGAELLFDKLPTVKGSPMHLRILFQNLIENGLKYQRDNATPSVSITSTSQGHDTPVHVHIKDNGIGIAAEHQHRIFEMFKRLHSSEEYSGNGLGLAICKRIALIHGSDVTVDSTLNEGSTFSVEFKQ